jgi:hypothetical protein
MIYIQTPTETPAQEIGMTTNNFQPRSTLSTIQSVIGGRYRSEVSADEAEIRLTEEATEEGLAEFLLDAFNRGWVTPFNVGLDADGNATSSGKENRIQQIIGAMYRAEISTDAAQTRLVLEVLKEELVAYILDAFNRGWITPFNLGLDDDGRPI